MPYKDKETKAAYDKLRRECQTPEWRAAELARLEQYVKDNPERVNAAKKKYAKSERGRTKKAEWTNANRPHLNEQNRVWYAKNQDSEKARNKNKNTQKRLELINILGGPVCVWCGFSWMPCMETDHIKDDGHADPHRFNKFWYCNHPEIARKTLQVLCANCNKAKEVYMLANPQDKGRITYDMVRAYFKD